MSGNSHLAGGAGGAITANTHVEPARADSIVPSPAAEDSNPRKEKSVLQAKLTKLAIQIGYVGKDPLSLGYHLVQGSATCGDPWGRITQLPGRRLNPRPSPVTSYPNSGTPILTSNGFRRERTTEN